MFLIHNWFLFPRNIEDARHALLTNELMELSNQIKSKSSDSGIKKYKKTGKIRKTTTINHRIQMPKTDVQYRPRM